MEAKIVSCGYGCYEVQSDLTPNLFPTSPYPLHNKSFSLSSPLIGGSEGGGGGKGIRFVSWNGANVKASLL